MTTDRWTPRAGGRDRSGRENSDRQSVGPEQQTREKKKRRQQMMMREGTGPLQIVCRDKPARCVGVDRTPVCESNKSVIPQCRPERASGRKPK